MQTRNSEVLASFVDYCEAHPDERFWQALRNWGGVSLVFVVRDGCEHLPGSELDTFHWEGRDG